VTLEGLAPEPVWRHFAGLSALPRPSQGEGAVLAYLKGLFTTWGLDWSQDTVGNLVVRKPASPGRPTQPTVVLQAHVDMVGEQEPGGTHDFTRDPLTLVVDDGWVRAEGTTLGADDGVGVALILAVLEDGSLVHGPLEGLFTVDEEKDMTGAAGLDAGLLTGTILLNLDGEGAGRFQIGSAGGSTTTGRIPVSQTRTDAPQGWLVTVGGLPGGHSGVDIHRQTGNALGLAARFASEFLGTQPPGTWQLAGFSGGDKDNTIPRGALLTWAGPREPGPLVAHARAAEALWAEELGPGVTPVVTVEPVPRPEHTLTPGSQQTLLDLVSALPDGVQTRSRVVPGLVETSCNLARVRVEGGEATVVVSLRSSDPGLLRDAGRRVRSVVTLAGGTVEAAGSYPPWRPPLESRLRTLAPALWTQVTGLPAVVEVVHAGLECGFLATKLPGADLISFGPELVDIHTPRERVEIASVARVYPYLCALLEAL